MGKAHNDEDEDAAGSTLDVRGSGGGSGRQPEDGLDVGEDWEGAVQPGRGQGAIHGAATGAAAEVRQNPAPSGTPAQQLGADLEQQPAEVVADSYDEYHDREGLRASQLKKLRTSGNAFSWPADSSSTASLVFGKRLHTLVLEPQVFASSYTLEPSWSDPTFHHDGRTKEGRAERKEWKGSDAKRLQDSEREAWQQGLEGREVLKLPEWDTLHDAEDAIRRHPDAVLLLDSCDAKELSVYWEDPAWGPAKARLDILHHDLQRVVDLKSAADVTPKGFAAAAHRFGYALQGLWYLRAAHAAGWQHLVDVTFIVVQNKPPHEVAVYTLAQEWLALAQRELDALLSRYQDVQQGVVEFGQRGHQVLEPPQWVPYDVDQLEQDTEK